MRGATGPLLAIAICLAACGCAAPAQRGRTLVEYQSGRAAVLREVRAAGLCTLYGPDRTRIESTTVQRGEVIGFAQQGGRLQAVDGSERIPLASGNYSWVMESFSPPSLPPPAPVEQPRINKDFESVVWQYMYKGVGMTGPYAWGEEGCHIVERTECDPLTARKECK